MIKKKVIILVLAGALCISAINSKAFIMLGAPVVAMLGSSAVTNVGTALLGVSLATLIGQQMGWLDIPSYDENANPVSVRLPLTPLLRDRPVSNPNAPTVSPVVNAEIIVPVSQVSGYTTCSGGTASSLSAACGSCLADYQAAYSDYTIGMSVTASSCEFTLNSSPWTSYTPNSSTALSCASGYTLDGNNCVKNAGTPSCGAGYALVNGACSLTNPQAIPDGKVDIEAMILASGLVGYTPIAGDPDQDANLTISQGAALFSMLHPDYVDGYPPNYWDGRADAPLIHVAVDPSGGSSGACPYQTCIPIPGLPGHFRISALSNTSAGAQAVVIDVNSSSGVVDQAVTVPLAGQILQAGSTYTNAAGQVSVVQAGQVVLANAAAGTYTQATQTAAPSTSINIPTDYARSGEATTAAKSITDKLGEVPDNTNDLGLPVLENPLSSYFNPLRAWSVPAMAGQCPTGSFSWNGNDYNFNVMCQLFNENLPIIQGAMNVLYVLAALFIVLGA